MRTSSTTPRLLAAAGVLLFCTALNAQSAKRYDGRTLDEWRAAIQELDYQSPSRAAAVPGLRAIINDEEVPWFTRRQAALTLGRIGEPAAPVIADLIRLVDAPLNPVETSPPLWALKALALFGPQAADAAPKAIGILKNESMPIIVRLTATETLGRIGVASRSGISALIEGGAGRLKTNDASDDRELRIACIESLQLPAPPSAAPMLIEACSDPSERIRHAAAATLGFLGTRADAAVDVLGSLVVFDDTPVVRETAARSLVKLGLAGIQVLERLLENDDDEVVLYAIDAVVQITSRRPALGPYLRKHFASANPIVAVHAMNAWWIVTRDAKPILNQLVKGLESDEREVRKVASDTLVLMGPAALPAAGELKRIAAEGAPTAQSAAERVLRVLPSPDKSAPIKAPL